MTTEIATTEGKDVLKNLLEKNKDFIARAAPKHVSPERLMQMALTAYTSVKGLRECWTPSVIGGIVQASIVGLELNTPLGQAYLIPFNDSKTGKKIAQFIIGYKGLIKLMQNSGAIKSIHADKVCANDTFEYEYGSNQFLKHKPAVGDRGGITHFYCYILTKDGGFQMEVMPKSQVDSIMAKSPTRGAFGPWKDHYDEMGIKTAIRRIAKYVPLSAEVASAIQVDAMGDAGLQDLTNLGGATIEGAIEPEQPEAGAAPAVIQPPTPSGTAAGGTAGTDKPKRGRPAAKQPEPAREQEPEQQDLAGAAPGAGVSQEPPATQPAPASIPFDAWLNKVEATQDAEILDVLEDQIRDMKQPSLQKLARDEIAKKRALLAGGLD